MPVSTTLTDTLSWNLLRCFEKSFHAGGLGDRKWTVEEIWKAYLRVYPPSYFKRKLGAVVSCSVIEARLTTLHRLGLMDREPVRFLDGQALKQDTLLYGISGSGLAALHARKKK